MSDDFHRRRRLPQDAPRRSNGGRNPNPWILTILAAIVVIVGGWFLGQGFAHMLGPKDRQTAQNQLMTPTPAITPLPSPEASVAPATPQPSPTASATPTAAPTATPAPKRAASPAAVAAATATPVATATPTATPAPSAPPATPTPAPIRTMRPRTSIPVARRPEPATAPATPAQEDAAARTVRAYIDALKRGDPQTAAMYLGNGVPDEAFINEKTHITSVSSTPNGDGSYKVGVDMRTSNGEYYETFVVAQTGNGARILDKTAIKP